MGLKNLKFLVYQVHKVCNVPFTFINFHLLPNVFFTTKETQRVFTKVRKGILYYSLFLFTNKLLTIIYSLITTFLTSVALLSRVSFKK